MSCLEVREILPELAVGVLSTDERTDVDRHLRWCAGCRKEAADLEGAAATFGLALAPAPVPEDLAERVVGRIRRAAGAPGTPRRARLAAAAIVAAFVSVASLGWGAVMAGRAERFAERAERADRERSAALERFQQVVVRVIPGAPVSDSETHLAPLHPVGGGTGGGFALQLVSATRLDFVMVIVSGLPERPEAMPYKVRLVNDAGEVLRVGTIAPAELDADGGAEVFRQFETTDLTGFTTVTVLDVDGEMVLTGVVDQSA